MIAFLKKLFHLFVKAMQYTNPTSTDIAGDTVDIELSSGSVGSASEHSNRSGLGSISNLSNQARKARKKTEETVDPLTLKAMTRY